MLKFSLIIPTLNEAENIGPLLDRILTAIVESDLEPEIIFVDDGSSDGTREAIEAYAGPLTVKLIRRDQVRGLTGAVVAGACAAENDFVVVMDSDLSHPPEAIPLLLAPLAADSHDMVIGSRYTKGGRTPDWQLVRRIASHVASFPAWLLTGVHDPLAGFFAVRRQHLTMINRDLNGFKVGLEVLAAKERPCRVAEVPINFQDRRRGTSKMNITILTKYLRQLLRLASARLSL